MKKLIFIYIIFMFSFAQSSEVIPPDGYGRVDQTYQSEKINKNHLNLLPIASSCEENFDVVILNKSTSVLLAEQNINKLDAIKQVTQRSQMGFNPLYVGSYMLKLIILRVDNPEVVEKTTLDYNQLMELQDADLRLTGIRRLPHKMQKVINDEVKSLKNKINMDMKTLEQINYALADFISRRPNLTTSLNGLNGNEKNYFYSLEKEFSVLRCQMIKKQKRKESLNQLKL